MNLTIGFFMAAWLIMAGGQTERTRDQAAQETTAKRSETSGGIAAASHDSPLDPDYKIGPQDILRIDVWKEQEVSRTAPVRPDGKKSLWPLLNDVQAAGLTPMQLAAVISEGLKKYLTNPQVTVMVAEINSRRIYVTGEVFKTWKPFLCCPT